MPHAIVLSQIPSKITKGESLSWEWSDSRFPAGTWTLVYSLVNASTQIQITAQADGSDHLVEVASNTTSGYVAGVYDWQAHVSNGGDERYKVASGSLTIVADYAEKTSGFDDRSHTKKVLDALEAAIEGRASKTQMHQDVGGTQVQYISLKEQVELRDKYAMKYHKEQALKVGKSSRRTIGSRFKN